VNQSVTIQIGLAYVIGVFVVRFNLLVWVRFCCCLAFRSKLDAVSELHCFCVWLILRPCLVPLAKF